MAELDIHSFSSTVEQDKATGLWTVNLPPGKRAFGCSFLSLLAVRPGLHLREVNAYLLETRDSFVAEVREAGYSDFALLAVTDASGTVWPVMDSEAALFFCKQAPPERRQYCYSALCASLGEAGPAAQQSVEFAQQVSRCGCVPVQVKSLLTGCLQVQCNFDYKAMFQRSDKRFTQTTPALLPSTRSASSKRQKGQSSEPEMTSVKVPHGTAQGKKTQRVAIYPSKMYADPKHKANYDRAVDIWVARHEGKLLQCANRCYAMKCQYSITQYVCCAAEPGSRVLCSVPADRKGDTDKQWVCPVPNCGKTMARPGLTWDHLTDHKELAGLTFQLFTGYFNPNAADPLSVSAITFKSSGEKQLGSNKRKQPEPKPEQEPQPEAHAGELSAPEHGPPAGQLIAQPAVTGTAHLLAPEQHMNELADAAALLSGGDREQALLQQLKDQQTAFEAKLQQNTILLLQQQLEWTKQQSANALETAKAQAQSQNHFASMLKGLKGTFIASSEKGGPEEI